MESRAIDVDTQLYIFDVNFGVKQFDNIPVSGKSLIQLKETVGNEYGFVSPKVSSSFFSFSFFSLFIKKEEENTHLFCSPLHILSSLLVCFYHREQKSRPIMIGKRLLCTGNKILQIDSCAFSQAT